MIEETVSRNSSILNSSNFSYTKDQQLEKIVSYYGGKISFDKRFEYENNYIIKLYYANKFRKDNEPIKPINVIFKYKFDEQNNWTEIVKNVNGQDLYKWVRELNTIKD